MATRGWYSRDTHPERTCVVCGNHYVPRGPSSLVCSIACRKERVRLVGWNSTERQYDKINGNWVRYFSRLLAKKGRGKISVDDLLLLLERQDGKCALTGQKLTCWLEKGKQTKTNASIDRLNAGGEYSIENIQLVCSVVNRLRLDMDVDEYIKWCKKVVNYAKKRSQL